MILPSIIVVSPVIIIPSLIIIISMTLVWPPVIPCWIISVVIIRMVVISFVIIILIICPIMVTSISVGSIAVVIPRSIIIPVLRRSPSSWLSCWGCILLTKVDDFLSILYSHWSIVWAFEWKIGQCVLSVHSIVECPRFKQVVYWIACWNCNLLELVRTFVITPSTYYQMPVFCPWEVPCHSLVQGIDP